LWAAAVEVAQENGCNRRAEALHLDGGKLRSRCWRQAFSRRDLRRQRFWS
jgi:hypothetical protein